LGRGGKGDQNHHTGPARHLGGKAETIEEGGGKLKEISESRLERYPVFCGRDQKRGDGRI